MDQISEGVRKYIRIFLVDEKGKQIQYNRTDGYSTSIDAGFEDLLLKEDCAKIDLYRTSKYINLYNNKTYEVIKREFMPCIPVTLYLYLKEV